MNNLFENLSGKQKLFAFTFFLVILSLIITTLTKDQETVVYVGLIICGILLITRPIWLPKDFGKTRVRKYSLWLVMVITLSYGFWEQLISNSVKKILEQLFPEFSENLKIHEVSPVFAFSFVLTAIFIINYFNRDNSENEKIISKQTELLEVNKTLIESQIESTKELTNATKTSSQLQIMNSVLEKVDKELIKGKKLSEGLIGQISSLSRNFLPVEVNNPFNEKVLLSREKGQLLNNLVSYNFDGGSYHKIYTKSDFTNCDMSNTDLRGRNFGAANLNGSSFIRASLSGANFAMTHLTEADLRNCQAFFTIFMASFMMRADLRNASISATDFRGVSLGGANLTGTGLLNCVVEENFFELLKQYEVKGKESIIDKYYLQAQEYKGKKYFLLKQKNGREGEIDLKFIFEKWNVS